MKPTNYNREEAQRALNAHREWKHIQKKWHLLTKSGKVYTSVLIYIADLNMN